MTDRARRPLISAAVGVLSALAMGSVAHADPAGPTDYESAVVAVEPATPSIEPSIVGGDSFVQLRVEPGAEVVVLGYEGEDYIWFRPDGVVLENDNSPTTHLNDDRYGTTDVPANATADAAPDWRQVATDGEWVWHDHRAHWMQTTRPVGKEPGDEILRAEIPMRVDGAAVEVVIASTWLADPSPAAAIIGALVGIALAVAAWALRRIGRPAVVAAIPPCVAAVVVGAWQYLSLPAATGPRLVWVVLPVVAVACAVAGTVVGRRSTFVADAALLIVGAELAIWGVVKRDGLGAAIVPTDAPQWADRAVTAMAMSAGVGFAGLALWGLFVASSTRADAGGAGGQRAQGADGLAAPGPVSTS